MKPSGEWCFIFMNWIVLKTHQGLDIQVIFLEHIKLVQWLLKRQLYAIDGKSHGDSERYIQFPEIDDKNSPKAIFRLLWMHDKKFISKWSEYFYIKIVQSFCVE